MREVRIASSERPLVLDEEHRLVPDPGPRFTPGQFFWEAGILIGVCLGLALFGQVLVMIIGTH